MNSNYTPPSSQHLSSRPVPDAKMALILSISNFVLCCIPFGIVSIVYAVKMKQALANDDIDGAYDADKKAKMWALIGAVSGALLYFLVVVLMVIGAMKG